MPPATLKFDGTYDFLKGQSIILDSADPQAYWFTHVRHEIAKYVGKEYSDGGDIHWTLEREKKNMLSPPSSMGEEAKYVDKDVFKVEVS